MKKMIMSLTMLLLTTSLFAVPKCWVENYPPVNGYQIVLDGNFALATDLSKGFPDDFLDTLEKEFEISSNMQDIGIIYVQAKLNKGETREEMKARVSDFLTELSKMDEDLVIECNWISHPQPGSTGHTIY